MIAYASKRLLLGLAIMLTISVAIFLLTNVASDPAIAMAGESASSEDIEAVRKAYGLDRPIVERYAEWLARAASGDLGVSYRQNRPVYVIIAERLPVTFLLALASLVFSLLIAIPLATLAAIGPGSIFDRIAVTVAYTAQAMPTFWLASLAILVFGVQLRWLPVSGSASWRSFILPAAVLGFYSTPALLRLTRSELREVMRSDFVRTARAKGLRMPKIVVKHALRYAIIPVVSIAAVQFGSLLSGSVVVETVFAMHGIGHLAWEAVSRADLPVVQALVLVTTFFYVILTLAADLLNAWLDPRLRTA